MRPTATASAPLRYRSRCAASVVLTLVGLVAAACSSTAAPVSHARTPSIPARSSPARSAYGGVTSGNPHLATVASLDFGDQLTAATTAFSAALNSLQAAVASGDLPAARTDELAAQADYDSFRTLADAAAPDVPRIDLLASDVGPDRTFTGLHAVERDLWTSGPAAADVGALVGRTPIEHLLMARPLLVTHQWFDPEAIGSTAVDELTWVVDEALPVDQEQFSHLGLVDIDATTQAAEQAFTAIEPLARQVDPTATYQVAAQFTALLADEHALGDPATVSDSTISPSARLTLSHQVDATASTLAGLTALLAPFGTNGGGS